MILGYLLALVFFIMAVILFLRRYRSYDKWLKDYRDGDDIPETMMSPEQYVRTDSCPSWQSADCNPLFSSFQNSYE